MILTVKDNRSFASDQRVFLAIACWFGDQNTRRSLKESIFLGQIEPEDGLHKGLNNSETTLRRCLEQSAQSWHGPCDDKIETGAASRNVTVQPDFDLQC